MLENPVLNRELIENLRSPRAFLMQAIFILLLGGIVLVAWPPEIELEVKEQRSLELYDTFARGQLILLALLAPILAAPAISSESERRSLDMLLTSPLSATAIVVGKLLSALVYLLLLAVSSLPVFSVCFRLGAVGYREVLSTFLMLFGTAYICGSIALFASAYMRRSRAALSVSYVVIIPVVLLLVLVNPLRSMPAAIALTFLAFVVGSALVGMVQRRLRLPFDTAPKAADEEDRDEQVGLVLDQHRFPDNLLSSRYDGKPLDERKNPVYEKELRHELFGQGTLLVRLLLQVSLMAALPFFIASLWAYIKYGDGLWVYSFYTLVFVMLLAPSLTAGVFTQERERGTLDLLLTTTLGKPHILKAKLLVNLRNISILTGFLVPFMILFWLIRGLHGDDTVAANWPYIVGGTILTVAGTSVLVVMIASFFSLICRTTLRSMVFTYLTLAGLFIVPMVLYRILTKFAHMPPREAHWWTVTSPFFALATFEPSSFRQLGFPLPGDAAGIHLAIYLAFTFGGGALLALIIYRLFDRYCQLRHDIGL